jgi:hypothetical protein
LHAEFKHNYITTEATSATTATTATATTKTQAKQFIQSKVPSAGLTL